MKNHIVLYEPVIPANTGNIARTAAGTNTTLHLIEPLGFSTEDKMLKRSGLDYWHDVDIRYHASLEDFMAYLNHRPLYLITKFAPRIYSDANFKENEVGEQFFMFGKETTGLPIELMETYKEQCLRIPMDDTHVRSLNLSNTVNIVLFEALRQQNFASLEHVHHYRDTPKSRELNW